MKIAKKSPASPASSQRSPFRQRFTTLKSTSLTRLRYRIRAKLASGWHVDGPILDITDYAPGERSHCWLQALCLPVAA
jgi:hypothetical protein